MTDVTLEPVPIPKGDGADEAVDLGRLLREEQDKSFGCQGEIECADVFSGNCACFNAALVRHRQAAWNEAVEAAAAEQPSTAENPNEDAYQLGRFNGIMEFLAAIRALRKDV